MVRGHIVLRSVAFTVFTFSLLVWVYVIVIQVTHTDWLSLPFSHVQYPPFDWRLDEVGMLAFAVAAIGFLIWQIERSIAKTR